MAVCKIAHQCAGIKRGNTNYANTGGYRHDDSTAGPLCIFQIKSYKLQPVYALGYDELAMAVADYDQTVEKQQKLILDLYAFEREKLETGTASESEIEWYIDVYEGLFGYKPTIAA